MAQVNRYDTPAQSNVLDTFVDTYVPIPFEEMMKIGMMKQKQYEDANDALQKTYEDTYNLKYIPNTPDEEYIKNHVIPTSRQIFDNYSTKDLTDPVVRRQMRNDFNTKIDKARVRDIQDSHSGWVDYQKEYGKLNIEGKTSPYQGDPVRGWDSSKRGVFTIQPKAYVDPVQEIGNDLFKPIHDSTLKKVSDGRGNIFVTSGVNQDVIDDISVKNLGNYLNRDNVKVKIREVRAITGLTEDQMSDPELVHKYIFQAAGQPYLRQNEKVEHLLGYKDAGKKGSKTPPPMFPNASNTQSLKNVDRKQISKDDIGVDLEEADDSIKMMKSGNYDAKGNLIVRRPSSGLPTNWGELGLDIWEGAKQILSTDKVKDINVDKAVQEKYQKQYNIQRQLIDHLRETSPSLSDKSDMEVMGAYSQAYKKSENADYNEYLYNNIPGAGDIKKHTTGMIIDDIGGRLLYSAQTGKHAGEKINTIDDIFSKLKVPKDDRKKSNIAISGVVPSKNAYKATVFAKDGPHDFLISTNQKEKYVFDPIEKATKLANDGILGDKELILYPGTDYKRRLVVRTKLVPTDNGYQFESFITSGDGDSVMPGHSPQEEIPLNELEWQAIQNLINIDKQNNPQDNVERNQGEEQTTSDTEDASVLNESSAE